MASLRRRARTDTWANRGGARFCFRKSESTKAGAGRPTARARPGTADEARGQRVLLLQKQKRRSRSRPRTERREPVRGAAPGTGRRKLDRFCRARNGGRIYARKSAELKTRKPHHTGKHQGAQGSRRDGEDERRFFSKTGRGPRAPRGRRRKPRGKHAQAPRVSRRRFFIVFLTPVIEATRWMPSKSRWWSSRP